MEWLKVEKLLTVIGDTTVLLISFIAIGIPLAIQTAKQLSDKYNAPFLAKRLINYKGINPRSLIVAATVYILISFLIRIRAIEPQKPVLILTLIYFFIIIICTALFYINMYRKSVERNEDTIKEILFNKGHVTSVHEKFNAGLELLLDGLANKSWQQEYTLILFDAMRKTREQGLRNNNILQIKNTWLFLLRLSKASRESQSAILSFNSQRLLFSLASTLIHSGNYHKYVDESRNTYSNERIELTRDIYELARWQSQQSNLGIDLALECEWIASIFDILRNPHYIHSKDGTLNALRLYIDILQLVAINHPKKILGHYKNLSESIPSVHIPDSEDIYTQYFFYRFYDYDHSFNDSKTIFEKLSELLESQNKINPHNITIDVTELEKKVDYKYLYEKALSKELRKTAANYIATLAYYARFDELIDCIEWKKPEHSTTHYIGEVLLPSSINELANQIFCCKGHEIDLRNFERHDPEIMLYRGYAAILTYFIGKNTPTSSDFFSTQQELLEISHSAKMLLGALDYLKSKKICCLDSIQLSIEFISNSLEEAKRRENNRILKAKLSSENVNIARAQIIERWANINQPDLSRSKIRHKLDFLQSLQVRYTGEIQALSVNLFSYTNDKKYFIDGYQQISNLEVFADEAFSQLYNVVCNHLFREAVVHDETSMLIDEETLLFCDKDTLIRLGFERASELTFYWRNKAVEGAEAIQTEDKTLKILRKNSYEIVLTKNVSIDGECPLFVTIEDIGDYKVNLTIGLYYSLRNLH